MCWITGGHTIQPPFEGLFPLTGIEPTSFQNSASKVTGELVNASIPGFNTLITEPTGFTEWSIISLVLCYLVRSSVSQKFFLELTH